MAANDLSKRIDALRQGFADERGYRFNHFFCPILKRDDDVELCEGHIIPEAFGNCGKWVPQRKDVDNFYGSVVEADFVKVVQDRKKRLPELWLDPKLRERHRPQIEFEGRRLEHYFPKHPMQIRGQTLVEVADDQGITVHSVALKISTDEASKLDGKDVQLVVNRDYRPAVVASLLKAAHLTLFNMLGYQYVFSPAGTYLGDILSKFFIANRKAGRDRLREALAMYFLPFACMAFPVEFEGDFFNGTAVDDRLLACIGASERVFATGVIIPAKDDTFCVFVPTYDGPAVETYFSFLKEPPPSIGVKLMQLCPPDGECSSKHWKVPTGEPARVQLPGSWQCGK